MIEPGNGDDCTSNGLFCPFDDTQCNCFMSNWDCDMCPMMQPMNMDTCMGGGGVAARCKYGNTVCVCQGGDWNCGDCPTTAPADDSECMVAGVRCGYGTTFCTCGGFGGQTTWQCTGGGGNDGGGTTTDGGGQAGCPPQQNPGGNCTRPPTQPCTYGMGNSCVCLQGQWFCN